VLFARPRTSIAGLGGRMQSLDNPWRSVLVACSLAVFLALPLGPCVPASADVVSGFTWQSPVSIDPAPSPSPYPPGPNKLDSISCPSESLCAALDVSGNVATSSDPTSGAPAWRVTRIDSNTQSCGESTCSASLSGISCVSPSLCVAVDTAGYVFWTTNPAADSGWQSAKLAVAGGFEALSCPSVSLCAAVDGAGEVVTSTNPTGGAAAWSTATVDSGPCPAQGRCQPAAHPPAIPLDAISCPSVSLCVAGDSDGDVVTSTDPTGGTSAWTVAYVDRKAYVGLIAPGLQTSITSVACPSPSLCVASDQSGGVVTSHNPAGGASAWTLTSAAAFSSGVYGLSCPSISRCIALNKGVSEAILTDQPLSRAPWVPVNISPGANQFGASLTSMSCPSVLLCLAVDEGGHVIVGDAKLLSRTDLHELLRATIRPPGNLSLHALLHSGAFSQAFNAPSVGSVRIRWLLLRSGPHSPATSNRMPVVARGQGAVPAPGRTTIEVKLTKLGIALLRHRQRVRLTAEASYSPLGSRPVTATTAFAIAH
jgi:hypothetical protein